MMKAELIFDQGDDVKVPTAMGKPKDHQNKGTVLERLAEIAGRVCYDSMGRGRSSSDWHKHILDVDHLSVYEHGQITIALPTDQFEDPTPVGTTDYDEALAIVSRLMGRPGITARFHHPKVGKPGFLRISFNPRCVLDWDKLPFCTEGDVIEKQIKRTMIRAVHVVAPQMVQNFPISSPDDCYKYEHVTQFFDTEKWCSFWLQSSRGWSHEQVRHGDFTGISQRSTRYVDESQSQWHLHPLLEVYFEENPGMFKDDLDDDIDTAKAAYQTIVKFLEPWLIERGIDKFTARKQARGAARGFLGNALSTQMIFSASIWEWKCYLGQRMSPHADAEIRLVANEVYEGLISSQHGALFVDYNVEEAPDGIGLVFVQ